jgi:hypothetical protein
MASDRRQVLLTDQRYTDDTLLWTKALPSTDNLGTDQSKRDTVQRNFLGARQPTTVARKAGAAGTVGPARSLKSSALKHTTANSEQKVGCIYEVPCGYDVMLDVAAAGWLLQEML